MPQDVLCSSVTYYILFLNIKLNYTFSTPFGQYQLAITDPPKSKETPTHIQRTRIRGSGKFIYNTTRNPLTCTEDLKSTDSNSDKPEKGSGICFKHLQILRTSLQ